MINEAYFAVSGYVATQPKSGRMPDGTRTLKMRVAWTPRVMDKATGQWTDRETSFVTVTCYRKIAENAWACLRRGDPITVRGSLRVREFTDQAGAKRNTVDVIADSLGHDMSRGISHYSKATQHSEPTAEEHEWSTSSERDPLPGDAAALGRGSEHLAGRSHSDDRAQLAAADDADDEGDAADLPDLPDLPDPASDEPDDELVGAHS
jgi:single-strand DNA-binding protein